MTDSSELLCRASFLLCNHLLNWASNNSPMARRIVSWGFSTVDRLIWLMGGISGKVHFIQKPCGLQFWSSELWMCCCMVCRAKQSPLPSISAVTHGRHDFDTQSLLVALYDVLGPPGFQRSPRILSLWMSQTPWVVFISFIYGIFKWEVLKLWSWYPHLWKCFFIQTLQVTWVQYCF